MRGGSRNGLEQNWGNWFTGFLRDGSGAVSGAGVASASVEGKDCECSTFRPQAIGPGARNRISPCCVVDLSSMAKAATNGSEVDQNPRDEQLVYGQSFRNESVEIDGKKFDHCKFENVTIVFHALAPADFLECQWTGAIYLKTDNDGAKGFMMLMEQMRHTPGLSMFKVGSVDNKGNIMPIAPGVPIDQSPTGPK
jgi:hypothetical protein